MVYKFLGLLSYNPNAQKCFLKCINFLTGRDYQKEYFQVIISEGRKKAVMTSARVQPFNGK